MEITREIAIKVRDTVDCGLTSGMGKPIPGEMCVEAAVCFAMGLPHSDEPTCVSKAFRSLKIALNDGQWSDNKARAKGLRRLAIVQLGSSEIDDNEFARRVVEMTIRKIIPIAMRAAALIHPMPEHKLALENSALLCEKEGTKSAAESAKSAAESAKSAAWSAAWSAESAKSAAWSAAWSAAEYAAESAAESAESAAESAKYAAWSAWSAESAKSAAESAKSAAKDQVLADFAEAVVQIAIEMKMPGCQFLDLVE